MYFSYMFDLEKIRPDLVSPSVYTSFSFVVLIGYQDNLSRDAKMISREIRWITRDIFGTSYAICFGIVLTVVYIKIVSVRH